MSGIYFKNQSPEWVNQVSRGLPKLRGDKKKFKKLSLVHPGGLSSEHFRYPCGHFSSLWETPAGNKESYTWALLMNSSCFTASQLI